MRVRLLAILILALILSFGLAGTPVAIQGRLTLSLGECSPPDGLQLPVGQGVAVHCCLYGEAPVVHVEFLVNEEIQHAVDVGAGEIVSWTWSPTQTGRYTLGIAAFADGHETAMVFRQVRVVPGEMPVRIP